MTKRSSNPVKFDDLFVSLGIINTTTLNMIKTTIHFPGTTLNPVELTLMHPIRVGERIELPPLQLKRMNNFNDVPSSFIVTEVAWIFPHGKARPIDPPTLELHVK